MAGMEARVVESLQVSSAEWMQRGWRLAPLWGGVRGACQPVRAAAGNQPIQQTEHSGATTQLARSPRLHLAHVGLIEAPGRKGGVRGVLQGMCESGLSAAACEACRARACRAAAWRPRSPHAHRGRCQARHQQQFAVIDLEAHLVWSDALQSERTSGWAAEGGGTGGNPSGGDPRHAPARAAARLSGSVTGACDRTNEADRARFGGVWTAVNVAKRLPHAADQGDPTVYNAPTIAQR